MDLKEFKDMGQIYPAPQLPARQSVGLVKMREAKRLMPRPYGRGCGVYLVIINVFKERNYFLTFVLIATAFFGLFIFISTVTIPGNDLEFQLSIYSQKDYALMVLLAILVGLNFSLQIYSFKKQKEQRGLLKSAGQVSVSGISGVFGAVVGTAACASCLAFFFGLIGLGAGSVYFVLKNQLYFLIAAIIVMLISLYFTARKVNGVCESCRIKRRD